MLLRWIATSMWRAWLGFAGLTVFGFVASYAMEVENPLRSDDPYLMGFLMGGIAAGMSVVYSIAEKVVGNRWWSSLCYGAAVCLWAVFVVATSANSPEGEDIGKLIAIASLVIGALGWPLYAFCVPRGLAVSLTVGALIALVMYVVVAVRMAMRH
jgi:hypothetical protein